MLSNLDVLLTWKPSAEEPGQTCTKCALTLPLSQYYKDNTRRSGKSKHMSTCGTCNVKSSNSKTKAWAKKFNCSSTTKTRAKHRPPEGTPCDCCGSPMSYSRGQSLMCFDHDPLTDTFRGWLCQKCNVGLGQLGDTRSSIKRALNYLINSTKPNEETKTAD